MNTVSAEQEEAEVRSAGMRLDHVMDRIESACAQAGRSMSDVALLAVSKRHPDAAVRAFWTASARRPPHRRPVALGENLVQAWSARLASPELADLRASGPLPWHIIGAIQTNKAKFIARGQPALVQSLDRPRLADALAKALRMAGTPQPLDVLIQVNIDGEDQKAGCAVDGRGALDALADAIAGHPELRLRGLMAIPRPASHGSPRPSFARLRGLLDGHRASTRPGIGDRVQGPPILSMGMSGDLEDAIAEGATMVRIGTALFGSRGDAV